RTLVCRTSTPEDPTAGTCSTGSRHVMSPTGNQQHRRFATSRLGGSPARTITSSGRRARPVTAGHPSPGGLRRGPQQPQRGDGRHGSANTGSSTGSAMTSAGPLVGVRLLTGGWQIKFRVQADGRTVLEVTDPAGSLAGSAATIRLPFLWIDAGWAGCA